MAPNRKINPDRLRDRLDKCPLSQKELAANIGTDVGTLSRWKTGKIRNIRSDNLARLCQSLGTTPTELCADGPLPEAATTIDAARRDQVTMKLDTACRNALSLVARRYGVTRQQIVEIAPLLFAIIAEQSLDERRKRLVAYHDAAPPHLRRSLRRADDEDDQKVLEAEECSIDKRDLFAARVGSWDANHDKDNPFARFLDKRLSETVLPSKKAVTWDEDAAPRYMIGIEELDDLLGKDEDARRLVLNGEVALAEMPRDTRKKTPVARASWVKEKADLNAHKLSVASEKLKKMDINQLPKPRRVATEDDEHVL